MVNHPNRNKRSMPVIYQVGVPGQKSPVRFAATIIRGIDGETWWRAECSKGSSSLSIGYPDPEHAIRACCRAIFGQVPSHMTIIG